MAILDLLILKRTLIEACHPRGRKIAKDRESAKNF